MASSNGGRWRRTFAPLPPGGAIVRLSGDVVAADVLVAILREHPSVEILTGPDKYDDGRQYLTVRVLSATEVLDSLLSTRDDTGGSR
jgi:hypothetical protein